MTTNLWLSLLLVLILLFSCRMRYLQQGGSNGALVQLVTSRAFPYVTETGVNTFDYLPVAWDSDYGFPDYDRIKYPYYFDQPL